MCGARTARPAASVLSGVGKAPSSPWRLPQSAGRHRHRQPPAASRQQKPYRHSRERGNPGTLLLRFNVLVLPLERPWIPAFAGTTDLEALGSDGVAGRYASAPRRLRPLRPLRPARRLWWESACRRWGSPGESPSPPLAKKATRPAPAEPLTAASHFLPSFPRKRESRDFAPALQRPGSPARTSMDSRFRGNDGLGGSGERRRCRPLRVSTAALVAGAAMAAKGLYREGLIAAMAAPTKRTDWPPQRHRRRRFTPPRRSAGGRRCRGRGLSRCAAASPGARTGARSGPGRCRRRRGRRRGPCGCRPR